MDRAVLALAFRRRHHSLGRQGAFPAAAAVPGGSLAQRPLALLDSLRLRRLAADRRSAIADLLAALRPDRRARTRSRLPARRRGGARHPAGRRARLRRHLPRPRLAPGRRGRRRARLRLRSGSRLAHPAYRPGAQPGLFRHHARADRTGAGARLSDLRVCRGHRRWLHGARPRPGRAARRLCPGRAGDRRHRHGAPALAGPAHRPAPAAGRRARRGAGRDRADPAHGRAGGGLEPPGDRPDRRRQGLAAPGRPADGALRQSLRRGRPAGEFLGRAEPRLRGPLRPAGPLSRPQHEPALSRADPDGAHPDHRHRPRRAAAPRDRRAQRRGPARADLHARALHPGFPPAVRTSRNLLLPPPRRRALHPRIWS